MALVRFRASGGSSAAVTPAQIPDASGSANRGNAAMSGGAMGGSSSVSSNSSGNMGGQPGQSMGGGNQSGMVGLLKLQIEIGTLQNQIYLLKDQFVTDKVRFNSLLNRKPETDLFVIDSLTETMLPSDLLTLSDSLTNNPMVKMYEADRAANQARIKMVTRMGYPMIGIGVNYTLVRKFPDVNTLMNGKDMVMPMVNVTLPIYRKKYNAMQREAGYLRDVADESVNSLHNDLAVQFREGMQKFDDAGRRITLYDRQASLAEKTITLLTASFSAAGTDFEEILRMQQQLLDYQYKHIEALVDRNRAVAYLMSIVSSN